MNDAPTDVEPWIEYVQRHAHGATNEEIGNKIGLHKASVGRWKDNVQPRAEHVVAFAREYGRAPVEALIHAGYIKPEEVGIAVEFAGSMRDVSNKAFAEELERRLDRLTELDSAGDDSEDGLVGDDFIEDSGVDGVEDRNQG